MTAVRTRGQKMAQTAYARISQRDRQKDFASFARGFPSLIHACGLAQAVAFARAKKHTGYLEDLAEVLKAVGYPEGMSVLSLEKAIHEGAVSTYVRLSRAVLQAAGWLKRYVEATEPDATKPDTTKPDATKPDATGRT